LLKKEHPFGCSKDLLYYCLRAPDNQIALPFIFPHRFLAVRADFYVAGINGIKIFNSFLPASRTAKRKREKFFNVACKFCGFHYFSSFLKGALFGYCLSYYYFSFLSNRVYFGNINTKLNEYKANLTNLKIEAKI
jgi:hypothetical protein